ncbi:MAG: rhombosortase [Nitrospiraceae bacterium]|nr:MAG: rhombosortase [Nitrospiraceae bacterium]
MNTRLPLVTISVLLLSAACYMLPDMTALFIYDRQSVLSGDIWRLISAHLVHFSGTHLAYDLLAFGIAGSIIEIKGDRYLGLLCLMMAVSIGIVLFIAIPDMRYYGGLSGLACGCISYLALTGIYEKRQSPVLYVLALLSLIIKTGLEIYFSDSLLPYPGEKSFVSVPLSHFTGIMTAFIFFFVRANSYFPGKRAVLSLVNQVHNTYKDITRYSRYKITPKSGKVVVTLDSNNIAGFKRLLDYQAPLAKNEHLLRYRKRGMTSDWVRNHFSSRRVMLNIIRLPNMENSGSQMMAIACW